MNLSPFLRVLVRIFTLLALCLGVFGPAGTRPADAVNPVLTVSVSEDAPGLDPAVDSSLVTWMISGQVFDTLTRLPAGSNAPQPGLAESWSTADGITWTFNLRSGVTFHDGTPLDAAVVQFNFNRWWDPANPFHTGTFEYFGNIFGFKGDPSLITSITTSGTNQVIITLSREERMLPWYLTMQPFAIASPKAIQAGTLSQIPVGTGPFYFIEWVPGDHVLLNANTSYWLKAPYMGGLKFQVIPSSAARLDAVRANTVPLAFDMSGQDYYAARADINLTVFPQPAPNVGFLGINRAKGPYANLLVRQAIAHAINKAKLIKDDYDPIDRAAGQFLPPEILGYDPALADYDYNPEQAKTLLAQAGFPNGFSTTLAYRNVYRLYLRNPAKVAQDIAADLAAVGINTTVKEMESTAFLDSIYAGNEELFLVGWGADFPHPSNMFAVFCGVFNVAFGPIDTAFCNSVSSAANIADPAAQEAAYRAISKTVQDNETLVPLAHDVNTVVGRSEVAGLELNIGIDGAEFENVYFVSGPNATAQPDAPAKIDVSGPQAPTTTLDIPAGSVSEPVVVAYSQETSAPPAPTGQSSVRQAFNLSAYQDAALLASLSFNQPVRITIDYSTRVPFVDPSTLELYVEAPAGSARTAMVDPWQPANSTCTVPKATSVDSVNHTVTAYVCSTGTFSLFAVQNKIDTFLPVLGR